MKISPQLKKELEGWHARLGKPFYFYDLAILSERARLLSNGAPRGARLYYAVMANDHPDVLRFFLENGWNVFVGSWSHLRLVERIGFDSSRIIAGITGLKSVDIRPLIGRVDTVVIGSETELAEASKSRSDSRFLVRVNVAEPSSGFRSVRSMGLPLAVVRSKWDEWRRRDSRLVGIHSYVGTNFEDGKELGTLAARVIDFSRQLSNLQVADLGGGFGAWPNQTAGASISRFWAEVRKSSADGMGVWIEPGRFLVSPAGWFVAPVSLVEERGGQVYVFLDASIGMFPRRLMFGASDTDHPMRVIGYGRRMAVWPRAVVVGNTTFSGDVFYEGPMPEVHEGDLIAFCRAGAYCRAAVSRFLGSSLPSEIVSSVNPARAAHVTAGDSVDGDQSYMGEEV